MGSLRFISGGRIDWANFMRNHAQQCENGVEQQPIDESKRVWDDRDYIEDAKTEAEIRESETRGDTIRLRQNEETEKAGRDMSKHRTMCPPTISNDVHPAPKGLTIAHAPEAADTGSIVGRCHNAEDDSQANSKDQDADMATLKSKPAITETVKGNVIKFGVLCTGGARQLSPLGGVRQLSPVSTVNGPPKEEWTKIEVCVDSGACESVMPANLCEHIPIVPSEQSIGGVEYEVANGESVPNLGERRCDIRTLNALTLTKRMHFQVADVHKALLSTAKCADMGYYCHLGINGGYLEDATTGERIPIRREGELYILDMWIRSAGSEQPNTGFVRPE